MSPNSSGDRQTALSEHGIGELLARGSRLAANLTGRIHSVLRLYRVDDVRDRDAELRQLVRLYPEPHGILARAKDLRLTDAVQARDRIVEVDIGVVGQELRIVTCRVASTSRSA